MGYFFISHSHQDIDFVNQFIDWLGEKNLLYWTDSQIRAGEEWKPAIDNAIRQSVGVIVVLTPSAVSSPYVTYEWSFAFGNGKVVIPILQKPVKGKTKIHPRLSEYQHRIFTDPENAPWELLFDELSAFAGRLDVPPPIAEAMRMLNRTDPDIMQGIHRLFDSSSPTSTDALAEAMHHDTRLVAREATVAFARKTAFTDERAVGPLTDNLLSNNFTGEETLNALINICRKTENPSAISGLEDCVRAGVLDVILLPGAIAALAEFNSPNSVELIRNALQSNSQTVRTHAATNLVRLLGESAIIDIANSIRSIPDDTTPSQMAVDSMVRLIGDFGESAYPAFEGLFNDDDRSNKANQVRFAIMQALVLRRTIDALTFLQAQLNNPNARQVRDQLVHAIDVARQNLGLRPQ